MSPSESNRKKEFKWSSWAIDNKTTIYVLMAIIFFLGIGAYNSMPRESFPEIRETKVYISTIYPGNTAEDVEKLITDPLEAKLKTISNLAELTSSSEEDYSMVVVEFDDDIDIEAAKLKVKDIVDAEKASEDWPVFNNAKVEPNVFELSQSEEVPILNINITGDYPVPQLKAYGTILKEAIEDLTEIKEVDLLGVQNEEVEVAVDIYKMMASRISFDDIITAISRENLTMSAGNLVANGQRRTVRIIGEIERPQDLEDFVIKSEFGNPIYLKDVADIVFKEESHTPMHENLEILWLCLTSKSEVGKTWYPRLIK